MSLDQGFLLVLLAVLLVLFAWGRWRYDVVAFAGLLVTALAGLVPLAKVFSGFGHPATVTVAVVLVISRGLQNAGTVDLITRRLRLETTPVGVHIGVFAGIAGGFSTVMNNVGALALMMPAAMQSAAKAKRPVALFLMPLSFAAILGGLVTLIGTPPNIIIASFRDGVAGEPFHMFDFSPVGGAVAASGILFVSAVGWRLIPRPARPKLTSREMFDIENYVAEASVQRGGPAVGMTLAELEKALDALDAVVLGVLRGDRRIDRTGPDEKLKARDTVILEAGPDALKEAIAKMKLKPRGADNGQRRILDGTDATMAEAVVQPTARIVGQSADSLRLPQRYRAHLVAVSRQGKPFRGRLKNFRFRAGDVILLEGEAERLPEIVASLGCLPLAERGLAAGRHHQAALALGIFVAAIAAASGGLVSMPLALAAGAGLMVAANIVPPRELYDSIDWPVIVLLGSLIPVGGALEATGATAVVAKQMLALLAGASPVLVLALMMIMTMALSDVLNNAATAVVMAPIAIDVATRLGTNTDAFLMAVAVGASCTFLTPIGHQNNTLIMGPGGYRFGDYWRMGLPLDVVVIAVAVPMLLWVWPL
jgi:di/tricarboxylate transporter